MLEEAKRRFDSGQTVSLKVLISIEDYKNKHVREQSLEQTREKFLEDTGLDLNDPSIYDTYYVSERREFVNFHGESKIPSLASFYMIWYEASKRED